MPKINYSFKSGFLLDFIQIVGVVVCVVLSLFGLGYAINNHTTDIGSQLLTRVNDLLGYYSNEIIRNLNLMENTTLSSQESQTNSIMANASVNQEALLLELQELNKKLENNQVKLEAEVLSSKTAIERLSNKLTKEGVKVKRKPTGTPTEYIPPRDRQINNLSDPSIDRWKENCFTERKTNTTLCYHNINTTKSTLICTESSSSTISKICQITNYD